MFTITNTGNNWTGNIIVNGGAVWFAPGSHERIRSSLGRPVCSLVF